MVRICIAVSCCLLGFVFKFSCTLDRSLAQISGILLGFCLSAIVCCLFCRCTTRVRSDDKPWPLLLVLLSEVHPGVGFFGGICLLTRLTLSKRRRERDRTRTTCHGCRGQVELRTLQFSTVQQASLSGLARYPDTAVLPLFTPHCLLS